MVSRRLVLLTLAGLFIAFAAYGSFVPLHLRHVAVRAAWQQFAATPLVPWAVASRSDFITNVLLFVPIGYFLLGGLAGRSRRLALALAAPTVLVAAGLSVAIEFGQSFVIDRTPSWNDVQAESLGALLGTLLWVALGRVSADWLAHLFHSDSERDRVYRALGLYVAVWIVLGLLPFDFTIRPQEIAEKLREGRIVLLPFGPGTTLRDAGGTLLMAIPLGAFGAVRARGGRTARSVLLGIGVGVVIAWAIEVAQAFSFSRVADVTDVLMNSAGVVSGAFLAALWPGRSSDAAKHDPAFRVWPLAVLVVWCVALVIRHWSPFNFVTDPAVIKERFPLMMRVPFYSYYWGFAPDVLADATTKLLMGVPVGGLLRLIWQPSTRLGRTLIAVAIVAASGALFLALELGQVLLPTRVPDQTDVYIGTAGAVIGMALVGLITRRRPEGVPAASPPVDVR